MTLRIAALLACLLAAAGLADRSATPSGLSLERIMADPEWLGAPPENFYFSDDGAKVYFDQRRRGERVLRDLSVIDLASAAIAPVPDAERAAIDQGGGEFDRAWARKAYLRNGDLFVRTLADGRVRQLTRTHETEADLLWLTDGRLAFRRGEDWYSYDLADNLVATLLDVELAKDPNAADGGFDYLKAQQLRLFETLQRGKDDDEKRRARERELGKLDPARAAFPTYLGSGHEVQQRALSPAADWLALAVQPKDAEAGKADSMPNYVSRSGMVESREVRTLVNRNPPVPQSVLLVHVASGASFALDLAGLPGIKDDPFKGMREGAVQWHVKHGAERKAIEKKLEPVTPRGVTVQQLRWSEDGKQLAVQLRAIDNKDRWLITVDLEKRRPVVQHRLTDPAWINWDFNEFGWLHDSKTLWYLSEESGYSQLYLRDVERRKTRQLTRGAFELHAVQTDRADRFAYFMANADAPGRYEVHRAELATGKLERLTSVGVRPDHLRAASDRAGPFQLSFDEQRLLFRHDDPTTPPDLFVQENRAGAEAKRLTDTVSAEYKAFAWQQPEIVAIPSTHQQQPIYARIYTPKDAAQGGKRPAVMFVHGAGYLQNVHQHFSYYFREFMFHQLLVQHGYVVIDMDYRASQGYGRDWRTAIYRQMGTPELEDFKDGVDWLVANRGVDASRIGIYGGSYGGFMTFMALFKEPEMFAAGAALRPVTDWAHYNHEYTSNILNTPEIDPIAYEISSPIEHAAGLKRPLLICHGMQDDNVFVQDSIRLGQRLLELKKEDWELALYPLDPHGFVNPDSWLDEYRRVFKLFETNLKP
jgi:dienelactone hydrolase